MGKNGMPSSLLNRSECRRKLIEQARDTRFYWKQIAENGGISVSSDTLDTLEAMVSAAIRRHVESLPSKGKTI